MLGKSFGRDMAVFYLRMHGGVCERERAELKAAASICVDLAYRKDMAITRAGTKLLLRVTARINERWKAN